MKHLYSYFSLFIALLPLPCFRKFTGIVENKEAKQMMKERRENTTINDQRTPKQKQTYEEPICLHISRKQPLSKQSLQNLNSDIKIRVVQCPDTPKTREMCRLEKFKIIILDGEIDDGFVKNLKIKGSCNEQTPVIYVASGELKDDVKSLVKDQFIDDVLFECSTFEQDLIKAVKRLISEPLQFAVTPKSNKGEGNNPKRQRLDKTPMSARRCIAKEFQSIENTAPIEKCPANQYQPLTSTNVFINMDIATSSHNYLDSMIDRQNLFNYNHLQTGDQQYNQLQQGSDTGNKMEMLTAAAEVSQALASLQAEMNQQENTSNNNENIAYNRTLEQQVLQATHPHSSTEVTNTNQMRTALQNAENAISSILSTDEMLPKITLSGARQLLDSALMDMQHKTPIEKEQKTDRPSDKKGNKSTERDKRARRSWSFKDNKTPTNKTDTSEMSMLERKELHLAKERQRRERIARSWHQLRKLIPLCDPSADKASVFEMTVAYIHHCWKNHSDKIHSINKDFEKFCLSRNGPPENMDDVDKMVDELLAREDP